MARFAIITLGMAALLALGLRFGGIWSGAALAYITAFTAFMDRIGGVSAADAPTGQEFPAGHGLSLLLGILHFPLLFGGIAALTGPALAPLEKGLCFFALALFLGQISNSNAHELIHRSARGPRRLGIAVYCSLLFGHHVSAHRHVHHVHAATDLDPNSARLGEGFYAFALHAWAGSFRQGLAAERARSIRNTGPCRLPPYAVYAVGALASCALAALLGGIAGLLWLIALAGYAQMQLLLSDYVQHYGLRRRKTPYGWEPVGPAHSWNAPHGFSSALMLNAPRHSDHHARPARAYPGLTLDRRSMPMLPQSLPVMAVIALVPPLWRRVMDRRVRAWSPSS